MMSTKQQPKTKKQRKVKETKEPEVAKPPKTPQKQQSEFVKIPYLRDLSPFSPTFRTVKKSYDTNGFHYDLAMIETPLNVHVPKSLIQEVQGKYNQISKLLLWQQDQQDQVNSGSGSIYSSIQHISQNQNISQKEGQNEPNNKIPQQAQQAQSQILQKAGQKIKLNKVYKKHQQKSIKIQQGQPKRKLTCNCKKTKCLKLYCDCFHQNQFCGPSCNCVGCHNTSQYQQQRYNSMLSLIERNPQAFHPKLSGEQHAKGCNCRKSGCLKKYCQCYQAGISCGQHCKCQQCKNCKSEDNQQNKRQRQSNQIGHTIQKSIEKNYISMDQQYSNEKQKV